jgi:serine/threonine protein phosphatase PrpC
LNQDKYGITLNFAGEAGDAMFAVYDGHGNDGHCAATFTKNKLPQVLAKYIRQKRVQKHMAQLTAEGKSTKGAWNPQVWPFLETSEFEQCCHKSFVETNHLMHAEKSVSSMLCVCTNLVSSMFPD